VIEKGRPRPAKRLGGRVASASLGQTGAGIMVLIRGRGKLCAVWGCARIGPCPASPQHLAGQLIIGGGEPVLRRCSSARALPGVMRERDLRQLYIIGKAPEDAAPEAETLYWNTRPPLERAAQAMNDRTAPISKPLTLRRAGDGRATAGNPADFDVMSGQRAIGRIFRSNSAPPDRPWMWTITGAAVMPRVRSHGFAPALAEAKTAFGAHWRRWLALH
jgi:hypothetical protein